MLIKAKRLITTDLVKVSFLNAVATLVRMLTGFVSVKVVAAVIGPSGIALLGQLNNFSSILLSISNGGINAGVTKYVSEYADSGEEYNFFLGTGFWITTVLSAIISIVLIFGAGYFSVQILHDIKYKAVFYIFGGTILFYALNALLIAVINGFKEYKNYVIANIMGSFVGLIFSVILALNFGVYGALIAAITFQSVVFFLTLGIIAKSPWFNWRAFIGKFRKSTAVKLGHFTIMALASAITIPAGQLIVRNFITKYRNIAEAGLWEGVNRISGMYLMVVTASLSVYYLPKLAQLKTRNELRQEIFGVYKLVLPFLLLATGAIYISRMLIIRILFTKEFFGMEDLFAFQLAGDFLKIAGWVLGYLLIAKAMTKVYVVMELFNFVLLVFTSFFLVQWYGPLGATIAYAIVYLVYIVILSVVFRKLLFRAG
jgi:PST family polysaccharide transporter